jgi:hypothetical protein
MLWLVGYLGSMNKHGSLLLKVAALSMKVSRRCLAKYSHIKSPHTFTQPQLMTGLVLKAYLKTTYRGLIDILAASEQLQDRLGLTRLPNYSTFKRFADRSATPEVLDALLGEILQEVGASQADVAMDSTGLETTSASAHYSTRIGRKRKQYVKVSVTVLCGSLLATGMVVDWGPRNDKVEAAVLLERTAAKVQPRQLFADAGYDAEWVHEYCRDHWGVQSFIPPAVHKADGTANGRYRSAMTALPKAYGLRWHVESFFSALKRTTGSALSARKEPALFAEAGLKVLAYAFRR